MTAGAAGRGLAALPRALRWLALGSLMSAAGLAAPAGGFRATPTVDARGFVDVWALRRDVIAVEALTPTSVEDGCSPESDPDDPPMSRQQIARHLQLEGRCIAAARSQARRFEAARTAFNRGWLPALKAAIARGDVVAEVIFRLCETTPVIDRGDEITTCNETKAAAAVARLREIGFRPAAEPCDPTVVTWKRAFRFCRSRHAVWATDAFAALRLNRQPQVPGQLTWGKELHHSGSPSVYTGLSFALPSAAEQEAHEREIDSLLGSDPRWAVFLLHRIGRHEWVPEGGVSTTHRLDAAWAGRYRLERGAGTWTDPLRAMTGMADVRRVGDTFRITIESGASAPHADVTDCTLRYSGGLTYPPELTPQGRQSAQRTSLGYFYEGGGWRAGTFSEDGAVDAALAPLDRHKRYRQVVMQCDGGESDANERIRFLILAGDILVEIAADSPFADRRLAVRHFRRVPR